MPELPEVQTTVNGLNQTVKGKKIVAVSTTYKSRFNAKETIKDPRFFKKFTELVVGKKIIGAERRAKNILIHLSGGYTILAHMKMTGFFHYNPPADTRFIRLTFTMEGGKILAFSDIRKFAKITLLETPHLHSSHHLAGLGPEPLDKSFDYKAFKEQLEKKPNGKVKQVLLDQSIIAGIGNIYSDEILWRASVHPLSRVAKIPEKNLKLMFTATKETLKKGIDFGGDSMSDYRNIRGERGRFQDYHRAYRRTNQPCDYPRCKGTISRTIVGTRSAHFCPVHQTLYK